MLILPQFNSKGIDLRMKLLPQKLGNTYRSYMVGKGHLGNRDVGHLPINRGKYAGVGTKANLHGFNLPRQSCNRLCSHHKHGDGRVQIIYARTY